MKKKCFFKTVCSCILGTALLLSSTSSSYASPNIQDIDSIADTVSETVSYTHLTLPTILRV